MLPISDTENVVAISAVVVASVANFFRVRLSTALSTINGGTQREGHSARGTWARLDPKDWGCFVRKERFKGVLCKMMAFKGRNFEIITP